MLLHFASAFFFALSCCCRNYFVGLKWTEFNQRNSGCEMTMKTEKKEPRDGKTRHGKAQQHTINTMWYVIVSLIVCYESEIANKFEFVCMVSDAHTTRFGVVYNGSRFRRSLPYTHAKTDICNEYQKKDLHKYVFVQQIHKLVWHSAAAAPDDEHFLRTKQPANRHSFRVSGSFSQHLQCRSLKRTTILMYLTLIHNVLPSVFILLLRARYRSQLLCISFSWRRIYETTYIRKKNGREKRRIMKE